MLRFLQVSLFLEGGVEVIGRRLRRQLQSALGTLLSLAGLVVASVPALAQEPHQYAAWNLNVESAALAFERLGGPNCSDTAYRLSIPTLSAETVYAMPVECPDLQRLAPGDAGHVGTYTVRNEGARSVRLKFRGLTSGKLFSGPSPLQLAVTDDQGNTYASDGKARTVSNLAPGEQVTLTVKYWWDPAAPNEYQGSQGTILLSLVAESAGNPGGGDPGGGDPGGGGTDDRPRTPPRQPPATDPGGPAIPASGRVVVHVLGDAFGDGSLRPLPGAAVTLGALSGSTDSTGQVVFDGLPFGLYTSMATAAHPVRGTDPLTGTGAAEITAEEPVGHITIVLTWPPEPPVPPPDVSELIDEEGPVLSEQNGSLTVRVLDASPRNPDGPLPMAGALVHVESWGGYTGENGELYLANLPLGTYTVYAEATEPSGRTSERRSGSVTVELTPEAPDQTVTIRLAWEDPAPQADLTPGSIAGRICAPRTGAARIWAVNEADETVATVVAATGRIGVWLDYELNGLAPGAWTLTLQNPGDREVSQRVVVSPGQVTRAPDFTVACTGDGLATPPHVGYFAAGVVLLLTGWQLRRMGRMRQA